MQELIYTCMYTYGTSGQGNDNRKVNYVADNKMQQQMAFHGVVLLFI